MKNPTKVFMQVDFNWIKLLGLDAASLLSYLIYKSDRTNIVCLKRETIMKDLDFTKKEYEKAVSILVNKSLVEVIPNYVSRMNGFKLIENLIISMGSPETYMGSPETYMGSPETHMGSPETYDKQEMKKSMGSPETYMGSPETYMGSPETYMGSPETYMGSPESTIKQETINNKQYNNPTLYPSQVQAPSHEQAHEREVSPVENDFASYLDTLAREAMHSSQCISTRVDFSDTQEEIKKKVRKTRKPKPELSCIDQKWTPFLEYVKNEFSILYPKHRNKQSTIQASLEFAQDMSNQSLDSQAILDIIKKIDAHYPVYCKENEFAVGPVRYLHDKMWTTSLKSTKPDHTNPERYTTRTW